MDGARVRRWVAGFEAAAAADRAERERRGPEPAWAVGVALTMIEVGRAHVAWAPAPGPPEEDDAVVWRTWARLRARLGR